MTDQPLLRVESLVTEFKTENGSVRALKGVDLTVEAGKTLALVGESGSGKSVTSLSIMRLIPAATGSMPAGRILFSGRDDVVRDLAQQPEAVMRRIRGNEISMIFQEPMTSLNPTLKVGAQIAEAARLHQGLDGSAARRRAIEMLSLVEIPDAKRRADVYPHQLSGGMRQRVMIAMALVCRPSLLIADEPTTALDVTVQLQILELIRRLQREIGMGVLFITHNLGVVAELADRVAVMYSGRIVETSTTEELFDRPSHPYTRGLLASMPVIDQEARKLGETPRLKEIPGSVPDPSSPPSGCDFHPRCSWMIDDCRRAVPTLLEVKADHLSRCLRWSELNV
ncbi:ABC transporter ATP-binding protein [Rhizobium sp. BK251]|uniref:ABC transporter ATP-binding protein n=1 Tax=Rhizobium sp. BK251 TaxID=2512125 RepID=UPI001052FA69|nr:ABC transporter ATP-binding protein [Rhizobium sp. BK251]TCL62936.1 peptide/nickel transport system ATP-binding protein/oligopeptide transport system ATP-binding protein [Rhizobium sp. BK251]